MEQRRRKIGIMGGTFDPIHIGHLVTAEAVRNEYSLDQVLFIPASSPPHKQDMDVTPPIHRYIMTVMATYSNPYFYVSTIEMERSGPSYTVDTIAALIEQFGESTELFFIMGADSAQELPTWNNVDRLLELCSVVAAARPGCADTIDDIIRYFGPLGQKRIHRLAAPELEISSTDIRERVREGNSIKYIVPDSVENYILKEGLYRSAGNFPEK